MTRTVARPPAPSDSFVEDADDAGVIASLLERPDSFEFVDMDAPPPTDDDAPPDVAAPAKIAGRIGYGPIVLKRILAGDPPPPPSLAVDRLLLKGDVNMFGGHGDAGKGVTLFHTAMCYAVGRPVFGTLNVRLPGPVILLVPEDGEAVARHHLDAIAAGLELSDHERRLAEERLLIVGDDRSVNLVTETQLVARAVAESGASLLIADPIANLIGGADENEETVASLVCDQLRRHVCRPLGCTVNLVQHMRKPSRENGDTAATVHDLKGSAGWANHARQVWSVSKPKGGSIITLTLVKSNRLATGQRHEIALAIDADPGNAAHWLSCKLTDANAGASSLTLTAGVGRAINDNERRALDALDDRHEPGRQMSWSAWVKGSGVKEDTLKGVKRRLLDGGLAAAVPAGQHRNGGKLYSYVITDRGRETLDTGWVAEAPKGVRVR